MPTNNDIQELLDQYFTGTLSKEEEERLIEAIRSNPDQTDALSQVFLLKAIQRIHEKDGKVLKDASELKASDLAELMKSMDLEDDDALIDSYLSGEISSQQEQEFVNRLHSDPDFRDRVKAVSMLTKGIDRVQKRDTQILKDADNLTAEDIRKVIQHPNREHRWINYVAVAAMILLLGGLGADFYRAQDTNSLASEGLSVVASDFEGDTFTRGGDTDVQAKLQHMIVSIKKKENLEQVISLLEKYYKTATDNYADYEDDYVDQISLALASAYIYHGDIDKAKAVLHHILNDANAAQDVKEEAQKMLSGIHKTIIF